MKILKTLLYIILFLALCFGGLIIYATITDYKPQEKEILATTPDAEIITVPQKLSLLIWNIGYCGLSSEMDFFYDGGKSMRTSKLQTVENMKYISEFINKIPVDFVLLQEIDTASKRSYYINQFEYFKKTLPQYTPFYAMNYNVAFVPLPLTEPMGKVKAGLAAFCRYQPQEATRFAFPGKFAWPKNLFMLDRCFLVNSYKLSNQKKLLVINTHNSAYDDEGTLKKQEMEYLRKFLIEQYEEGNYIIVGGDWNQNPPKFETDGKMFAETAIKPDFLPAQWKWTYDKKTPTNRKLQTPYNKETTQVTIIDFFLLSPNVETVSVQTFDFNFKNSDHQPVLLIVEIK